MNQQLIAQVQAGTHCIEHTRKLEDNYRLNKLLKAIYGDGMPADGEDKYYQNSSRSGDRTWVWCNSTGLTPIPLDDFFKEEESEIKTSTELFRKHFGEVSGVSLKHPNIESFFEELNEECKREDRLKLLLTDKNEKK